MEFEWDEAKRKANLAKHGLDFGNAIEFQWEDAVTWPDLRKHYGEERFLALGLFRGRVHSIAYAERSGVTRVISFRRAERREVKRYEQEKDQPRRL
jgi:hypothetical protein